MKFIVFYLHFINSLEDLGIIFSSAALIRRLRRYTATLLITFFRSICSFISFYLKNPSQKLRLFWSFFLPFFSS